MATDFEGQFMVPLCLSAGELKIVLRKNTNEEKGMGYPSKLNYKMTRINFKSVRTTVRVQNMTPRDASQVTSGSHGFRFPISVRKIKNRNGQCKRIQGR